MRVVKGKYGRVLTTYIKIRIEVERESEKLPEERKNSEIMEEETYVLASEREEM